MNNLICRCCQKRQEALKLDFNLDLEYFDPLGIDSLREILITSSTLKEQQTDRKIGSNHLS